MSERPGRGDPGDDAVPVRSGFDVAHRFDVAHLQAVHRRLFHGVDPEAGRLRTVDPPATPGTDDPTDREVVIAVPARHIRTAGGKVLGVLDRAGLRGLATGTVAAVLAELSVDLRMLRPFQAGNDEAIQVFLSELAADAGYRIDWPAVPPAAVTAACDTGDPDPLRVVLEESGTNWGR
jgi:cell filamentation protein